MWRVMLGEAGEDRFHFFFVDDDRVRAVRSGNWKLILDTQELFDLQSDIGESVDISAEQPSVVRDLTEAASAFIERVRREESTRRAVGSCS